jgi:hypothetical protein
MRTTLFIAAAGFAFAIAGQALAAPPSAGNSNMPPTDAPTQSTAPSSSPDSSTAPSGSAADTSATAGSAAAAPALTVGEPVKDNTGATIGAITKLSVGTNGQQMAVIKMGNDTFQAPSDRLGATDGAAEINMTQAQITAMIHPAAGGK